MVDSRGTEKGETSRKRHGLVDNGAVGRMAGKKLRPTKVLDRVSRKRVWNEMVETDISASKAQILNRGSSVLESQGEATSDSPARKVLRTSPVKEDDHNVAEDTKITNLSESGDDNGSGRGGSLELSKGIESQCKSGVLGDTQSSRGRPRRWKPHATTTSSVNQGRDESDGATFRGSALCEGDRNGDDPRSLSAAEAELVVENANVGKEQKVYQHEAIRKGLQTVNLEGNGVEDSKQSIREISEDVVTGGGRHLLGPTQEITESRDKKRKGKIHELPLQHPEKKICTRRIPEPLQEKETFMKKRWKKLVRQDLNVRNTSVDVGVMVSDAWKRLREKSTDTSCSSVNGQTESDLSMSSDNSAKELIQRNAKKARYEQHVPLNGKKWKRMNRGKREGRTTKRIQEDSVSESSTSSSSDVAQTYLHNRMWKRPRFENLMSVQARPWRRQNRDVEVTEENTRKRSQTDAAARSQKRARK